jgi:hypothetical protein
LIAAAASAWGCSLVVVHATPIDRALPFLAVVVIALAAMSHRVLAVAVPLLMVAEIAIADETTRLLAMGAVLAICFAVWCRLPPHPSSAASRVSWKLAPYAGTILAILVLRWIPFSEVLVVRELILLALAVAIVIALRNTPFGAAVAVVTALVTPAVPMRTLALPVLVLIVAALTRPKWKLALPSAAVVALPMLFFAWSGIAARAFPYFLKNSRPAERKHLVNAALAPNRSVTVDVPHDATALIVSGANVPRFRRGVILGRIEPGNIPVRIGDGSDWGYLRRESFYEARNPLPRDPAGQIRGYGYTAWVDGAGRIALPKNARTIRVTADANLPADAALQVEAFELR